MAVKVNNISVPRIPRNKRIYAGYSKSEVRGGVAIIPGKAIIPFENTDTPVVADYNTLFAPTYGQFPTVELYQTYTDEEANKRRRKLTAEPDFIMNQETDLIASISFGQWGDTITGFITLSK